MTDDSRCLSLWLIPPEGRSPERSEGELLDIKSGDFPVPFERGPVESNLLKPERADFRIHVHYFHDQVRTSMIAFCTKQP